MVAAEEADLIIVSADCGARGRWISLIGQDVDICVETVEGAAIPASCSRSIQIGGSDTPFALDDQLLVYTVDNIEHRLSLFDRTDTPFEWLDAEDLSFDVVFEKVSPFITAR